MARTLCPDRERASIAVTAALIILFSGSSISQIAAILLSGIAGLWLCRAGPPKKGSLRHSLAEPARWFSSQVFPFCPPQFLPF